MTVRVTIAQLAVSGDRPANEHVVRTAFRSAASVGSELLVLPEYSSGFDPHGVGPEHAEPISGRYVSFLRSQARATGAAVIAGTVLPGTDPARPVNAAVAVDRDGEIAGVYRKVHLYDAFGHRESDRLEAGDPGADPLVIDVGGLRFGVMTCYDLRFPESARRLVDAGADALVVPAAWASGPLKVDHWRTLARARAIENTALVLAVGQAGDGVSGHSLLVGPDGQVGLELGDVPEIRTVDLDGALLADARRTNPSLANRRYRVVPD
ncbi:hydrolase [Paraoerskovia sediminicola]|uniref:Hydrolase n=1 Tax=Paraoerskovia sediminicola TaxID=1138587 RepID=A0ABM8G3S3_9CELL|nr:carbon-nitrogen hydrolase family protein [Paraoerskovia sediminicola]BDZ42786.1 hydrolase [Paraoerskovia sediminicola]